MTIVTTDEHKAAQESMRGWAESVRPIATMRVRADGSTRSATGYWRAYWPALADLGIFRVAVAEDAGDAGESVADLAILVEQAAHDLVGGPVLATARPESRSMAAGCCAGRRYGPRWRTRRTGRNAWPAPTSRRRTPWHSYFLVDMRSAGLQVRPLVQITGEAHFSAVLLDDVFVPDDCLVGPLNGGWKIARSTLSAERVAMSGNGMGPVLEDLIAKLPATGPGAELLNDRLGGFISDAIAGLLLEQHAAVRMLKGGDACAQSSVRKLVGVRHRQAVVEFAVETAGLTGAQESEVVKEFLLTRCLSIAGGTEQILLTVAGERILGLPRDVDS